MPDIDPQALAHMLPDADSFSSLLDELPIGVAVMKPDGTLLTVNKTYETLTGIDRERAVGLKCLHSLRCDYCVKGCPVMTGWDKTECTNVEANIVNRERSKTFVRLTVTPLMNENGTIHGIVETISGKNQHIMGATAASPFGLGGLVGKSPQIERVFTMVPSIAQTDSSVLITGETGTGKDLLAEEIHNASDRNQGPFIKVNCGALPDTLLESELFGHNKGAFTGADNNKPGRFRMAHGGTLFLTEIGDLPLALQVKLLSFLDDKVIYPLGSTKGFHADVRVIVATHRDLEAMVQEKRFRQDLLYRLNVIRLQLPPLRERGEDIGLLQDHFMKMFQARFGKTVDGFSENARNLLKSYRYPGNVRELRNLIEYAVNFCDGSTIRLRHLPGYMLQESSQPVEQHPAPLPDHASPQTVTAPSPQPEKWENVQRQMIIDALVKTGGRKQQAAKMLGWGRSTLWRKMKHFGID
ncbi:sigma 54-interacting transcriptional regulator [uncultured Pseudodesulfovibrio sp.]|uniref:sigma-54 interaction domain-containing protein n=1 Tax=uncultured Pseudodesulfovibrio sp. TaxID=2035858 RepID=UPI0029C90925|nr:sigma 54-interacting transcriptional regulator [uncultured Pseudodesulfovibrio sp.]